MNTVNEFKLFLANHVYTVSVGRYTKILYPQDRPLMTSDLIQLACKCMQQLKTLHFPKNSLRNYVTRHICSKISPYCTGAPDVTLKI